MNVRSIAVVGGGPCGAGLTKALAAEHQFTRIQVFERRHKTGGLWNYTPLKSITASTNAVPNTDPFATIPKSSANGEQFYESPVYKFLDANVPKDLMAYKDFPFGQDVPLFPTHDQILSYIEEYSKGVEQYINFDTEVVSAEAVKDGWSVTSRHLTSGDETTEVFDALCVAVGSYDQPFIPDVTGLKDWNSKHPGSIIHAKSYDEPAQFEKSGNILVVGNSASGADIAYQLATELNKEVYKSIRSENHMPAAHSPLVKDVPDLREFHADTKTVVFQDGSSISGVDSVVFCTGYLKSFPFLKNPQLITDGQKVHHLYNHLVYIQNPTLAVIGVPRFVLPTRLSESQGCWLARVWSGKIHLPSVDEMEAQCASLEGNERAHHDLMYPRDVEYSNALNAQVREASDLSGYQAVEWDEGQCKIRANIKPLKEAYTRYHAETGKRAQSIGELEKAGYFQFPVDL